MSRMRFTRSMFSQPLGFAIGAMIVPVIGSMVGTWFNFACLLLICPGSIVLAERSRAKEQRELAASREQRKAAYDARCEQLKAEYDDDRKRLLIEGRPPGGSIDLDKLVEVLSKLDMLNKTFTEAFYEAFTEVEEEQLKAGYDAERKALLVECYPQDEAIGFRLDEAFYEALDNLVEALDWLDDAFTEALDWLDEASYEAEREGESIGPMLDEALYQAVAKLDRAFYESLRRI